MFPHCNLLTQTVLGRTVKSKRSEKKNEGNLLTDWKYHGCHEPISSFLLVLQRKLLLMCQTSHNQQPEPNWRSVWQSYLSMYLFILFQSLKVPVCKIPTHTHIHELYISLCILISGSRGTRLNNSILCQYIPIMNTGPLNSKISNFQLFFFNYSDCTDVLPQTG